MAGQSARGDQSSRRAWNNEAVHLIEADYNRTSDTHLILHRFLAGPEIRLYLKDESSHPTGSLKHRLARSLFLYGLCNDWIGPDTTIVEASSGSTAVSEAYFARMLGLRFIAVVPKSVAAAKIDLIRFQGGEIHYVDNPADVYDGAQRLARGNRRPLHGPVHLCRAGDRLARQQQHRPIHLQPAAKPSRSQFPNGSSAAPEPAGHRPPSGGSSATSSFDPTVRRRSGGIDIPPSLRRSKRDEPAECDANRAASKGSAALGSSRPSSRRSSTG